MAYGDYKGREDMDFLFDPIEVSSLNASIYKKICRYISTNNIKKDEETEV
jgi:hypothetical protein